jgi:hypothetical protein
MKTVVVGGHTRNIGKTGVMAGIIQELAGLGWTAVKITQYGHGVCSLDGKPCGCEPKEHPFVLREERDPNRRTDTSRFLQAGARRSLWLRVRQGCLADGLPLLEQALKDDPWVIIESNSLLEFLRPDIYLFVLDSSRSDFKTSALRFIAEADACVATCQRLEISAWPALDVTAFDGKPLFPVASGAWTSNELQRFLRAQLGLN